MVHSSPLGDPELHLGMLSRVLASCASSAEGERLQSDSRGPFPPLLSLCVSEVEPSLRDWHGWSSFGVGGSKLKVR